MAELQFFYRKDTLQIDAVYRECSTNSALFKDTVVYTEVNITDPPYAVTRDHKVLLENGEVIGTEYNLNPNQPTPPEPTPTVVVTIPPSGKKKITNIYWDAVTEEYVLEHEG